MADDSELERLRAQTSVTVPVLLVSEATGLSMGFVTFDVRTFGFLNIAEAMRDPDWPRYVAEAVREA
jgi:hypothetical protein